MAVEARAVFTTLTLAPAGAERRGPAIRLEGSLLGPDILEALQSGDLPGQKPADFGLPAHVPLLEEMAATFEEARNIWLAFQHKLDRLPPEDPATTLTREAWMRPFLTLLGYELHFNRREYYEEVGNYPISHRAGENLDAPPVHIVGARDDLGRVPASGRPRISPHALVQEFLNRSEHLWGIVTNGRVLRLLRKSTDVRRQSYVEFDLEAIFGQNRLEDFVLLYRLLHRTRLPQGIAGAADCWLERYHRLAVEQGNRVRDRLRDGVEEALKILGTALLRHAARKGEPLPDPRAFHQDLLRLVYRFLFLLVAEERGLMGGNDLYRDHYSISRLRRLVDNRRAYTDHEDLWLSLNILWELPRDDTPVPQLGGRPKAAVLDLTVLDGQLFEPLPLDAWSVPNRDLLRAIYHLVYYYDEEAKTTRRVNYAALDVEELGSIYESLLDLQPQIVRQDGLPTFTFDEGTERKSTGSYYTPHELVDELIRSALEPVIEERLQVAKRVASSEWRVVREELHKYLGGVYEHSLLSRLGDLAKRHGPGGDDLPPDRQFSAGGTFRPGESDAAGGQFGAGQHRGGVGSPRDAGISPFSEHRGGKPAGTGDVPSAKPARGTHQPETGPTHAGTPGGYQPPNPGAATSTEAEIARLWNRLPLATRHSLLAEHLLLSIKILDPAAGSGHFLLAAARRLGKELARVRTGEEEPAPEALREAVRDVIAHCIYGVDRNPMAVELCKVALWIEGHVPGKPLTFLDHRIRCGDSLVGVLDLSVLREGIPDGAYEPVSGDDKAIARGLARRNKEQKTGQLTFLTGERALSLEDLAETFATFAALEEMHAGDVRAKAELYEDIRRRGGRWWTLWMACNLWTAAFFTPFTREHAARVPTTADVRRFLENPAVADPQMLAWAEALATRHRFFHWPLEFPDVFGRVASSEGRVASGEQEQPLATHHSPLAFAGFDVVLGNPPWERIKLQEKEFFATRDPEIANAPNAAARKRMIEELPKKNPALWQEYQEALHVAESTSRFLRGSGFYPLTGRGDINTYSVFAERMRALLKPGGRAGIIVPTGIATDDTNKFFFADLVDSGSLLSLYDFENREGIFPHIHRSYKFSLVTMKGRANGERRTATRDHSPLATHHSSMTFVFFATRAEHLRDPRRRFILTPEDIARINPNTRTLPVFRTRQDAELTRAIYERVPVLVNERTGENPWGVRFLRMLDMSNDSHLFRTAAELEVAGYRRVGNRFVRREASSESQVASSEQEQPLATRHSPLASTYLPLYEAKMIWHYDHRFGTYEGVDSRSSTHLPTPDEARHADPAYLVQPWYWVPAEEVEARLEGWERGWLLGFRDVTNATNERTAVFSLLPRVGVGHTMPLLLGEEANALQTTALLVNLNSLAFDWVLRQKMGGTHLTFFILRQLPVLPPSAYTPEDLLFIVPRVLELVYTAWDLKPFADDVWHEAANGERRTVNGGHSPFAIHHSPHPLSPLQQAILRQWAENRAETGGHPFDLPAWADAYPEITPADPAVGEALASSEWRGGEWRVASSYHSPLTTRHSPHCPLPPFKWNDDRRARLRAELDAYYARLYGLTRKQLRYILDPADLTERELEDILDPWEEVRDPLDPAGYAARVAASTFPGETFRVLKEKEMWQYGEYRTRRLVLEAWERLARGE